MRITIRTTHDTEDNESKTYKMVLSAASLDSSNRKLNAVYKPKHTFGVFGRIKLILMNLFKWKTRTVGFNEETQDT